MFAVVLFALFIVVPLLEIWVVIEVGRAIGVAPTLALLIADALLGTALVRSQSRSVWRRAREALRAGRVPAREVLDGALVAAGGALLIAPGFITDLFGAALLAPPSRAMVRRRVVRRFTRRGTAAQVRFSSSTAEVYDVDASAVEVSEGQLER